MRERGVTVIANAGGVNPLACAREVVRLAPGLKVAVVLGDDVYPPHRRVPGEGLRDARYGYRRADRRDPRPHPERERLHRRVPAGGGAGHGRERGDRRALHRYRAGAGADGSPVRLDGGRLRQARGGHDRRTHHRMRRAVHRRQLPGGLADHSRHGEHRLPDRRGGARRQLRGDEARGGRRARVASIR